jgi:bilirubin oxidase
MSGQVVYLKNFGSELPTGIYGADTVGIGMDTIPEYEANFLNGSDYNILKLNIESPTVGAVTTLPSSLVTLTPYPVVSATNYRTVVMDTIRLLPSDVPNRAEGPFGMNNETFDIGIVNDTVHLNATEIWTLTNHTLVAHPFHIHDVQFNVIEKDGRPTPPTERGWKDVVLVMPGTEVKFITRFTDFADNMTPYMYHCHLLHHEDDGMMGSFLVIDTAATGFPYQNSKNALDAIVYPNPATGNLFIKFKNEIESAQLFLVNLLGETISSQMISKATYAMVDISKQPAGIYYIQVRSGTSVFIKKIAKL